MEANNNKLAQAKNLYLTQDLSILEVFQVNLIGLAIKNTLLFKFKEVHYSYKTFFVTITAKNKLEYCFLKPIIKTKLEKQVKNRFYDYS